MTPTNKPEQISAGNPLRPGSRTLRWVRSAGNGYEHSQHKT